MGTEASEASGLKQELLSKEERAVDGASEPSTTAAPSTGVGGQSGPDAPKVDIGVSSSEEQPKEAAKAEATATQTGSVAPPKAPAPAPSLFDGFFNTINDLSKQATDAVGDLGNTVVNLGTHATKLSTSLTAAEEQWREHFPRGAPKDDAEGDDEKLLNFFFCKLQLNVGDCPGTLFVTSAGLYFLSDNELEYNTDEDEVDTSHYRVAIPLNCVSGMAPQINPKLDVERYLQVVTADGFDFWFTGFLNYDSAFATLLGALHDVGRHTDSLLKGAS